jgi:hypothetical protein
MPAKVTVALWRGNTESLIFHTRDRAGVPLDLTGYVASWWSAASVHSHGDEIKIKKDSGELGGVTIDGADIIVAIEPDDTAELLPPDDLAYHELAIMGFVNFGGFPIVASRLAFGPVLFGPSSIGGGAPGGAIGGVMDLSPQEFDAVLDTD